MIVAWVLFMAVILAVAAAVDYEADLLFWERMRQAGDPET